MMNRYLIESPHTAQDCHSVVEQVRAAGYLHNFDWGCLSGVHCGWAIIEAESEEQAHMAVPAIVRRKARVVKLNRFDPIEDQAVHRP